MSFDSMLVSRYCTERADGARTVSENMLVGWRTDLVPFIRVCNLLFAQGKAYSSLQAASSGRDVFISVDLRQRPFLCLFLVANLKGF